MKQGRTLTELAQELQRRHEVKQDLVVDTSALNMVPHQAPTLAVQNNELTISPHTHRQLGTHLNIPAKYYDRLLEHSPDLLANNVNYWLHKQPVRRMVRTLDGTARAYLSDRYRRIDNEDVAEAVIPVLLEGSHTVIRSCEVTDSKMYIKALFPRVEGEVAVGDQVQAGVVISNSEIGLGSLNIQPLVYRLVCSNGMISQDYGMKRYHVGRKIDGDGQDVSVLFKDETLLADDRALMMKIRDIVQSAASPELFQKMLSKLQEATQGEKITQPVAAVEVLSNTLQLNEGEKNSVLEQLIRSGDYSQWGALNAVTATANDSPDYDRATELEAMGGQVLNLAATEWRSITEAA